MQTSGAVILETMRNTTMRFVVEIVHARLARLKDNDIMGADQTLVRLTLLAFRGR